MSINNIMAKNEWIFMIFSGWVDYDTKNKSGIKRRNTPGRLDQSMAQPGRIVKQSCYETV